MDLSRPNHGRLFWGATSTVAAVGVPADGMCRVRHLHPFSGKSCALPMIGVKRAAWGGEMEAA